MVLLLGLLSMILIYSFGWSGSLHFDDEVNLGGLARVFAQGDLDPRAASEFIFSGHAGPLGRPIALLSFLMDGSGWPHDVWALLYTNTLIHGLNGVILSAILLLLGRSRGWHEKQTVWIAVISATLWLLLPLLASSSLMAVQRMTVLSSSFMLAGLWIYLFGRSRVPSSPGPGFILMMLGLGLGTFLGALTKEQAALLPTLILVLECVWLPALSVASGRQKKLWLVFRILALYLPTVLIFIYLLRILPNAQSAYALRDFSLSERLWTESVILWDYLRLGFLPRSAVLGPFHDDYPVLGMGWPAGLATFLWIVVWILAWLLRRRSSLPLMALMWYWACHLIESTVIPLELYFEHRNYLAMVMPMFALATGSWIYFSRTNNLRLGAILCSAYTLLLAGVLFQTTSLFGHPRMGAEIWYTQHERSPRSAIYLSQQLILAGERQTALKIIDHTAGLLDHPGDLNLQGLLLACGREGVDQLEARYQNIERDLPKTGNRYSIISSLNKLKDLQDKGKCVEFLDRDRLIELSEIALQNRQFLSNPQNRANLHVFIASIYIDDRDLDKTMYHLLKALNSVSDVPTLKLTAAVLNSAGLGQTALNIIDQHPPKASRNPWIRTRIDSEIRDLRASVHTLSLPGLNSD